MNTILLAIIAAAGLSVLALGLVWTYLYQDKLRELAYAVRFKRAFYKSCKLASKRRRQ